MQRNSHRAGFTFIQLSVLLTIASLTMVALLPSVQAPVVKTGNSADKMSGILTALRQYQAATCSLPCPADPLLATGANNYGVASTQTGTTNNCVTGGIYADTTKHIALGMVPWRTLGLSYDYALDAWGRDITYAVDTGATWQGSWAATSAITVTDNGISNNSVVALVSHGQDGFGAWLPLAGASGTASRFNNGSTDASQAANAQVTPDGNMTNLTSFTSFINKPFTPTFDDLVVYSSNSWNINNAPLLFTKNTTISPPVNGTYGSGATLTFTITAAQPIAITPGQPGNTMPRLVLSALSGGSIGTGNVAYATYVSGNNTNTLTFTYTVQGGDLAPNGIAINSLIDLNNASMSFCLPYSVPDLSQVVILNTYYRTVTIDHTKVPNTDQTNFPVLFSGTYAYLATAANGGKVQNVNGYDITFTADQAGTVPLSFEQESYNPTTGNVVYWIKVPAVSHTADTVIYLRYDNPSITTDQSNKTAVWDANYLGVWHLPNGTSLTAKDSTANAINGTITGVTATTGQIDGGATSFTNSKQIKFSRTAVLDSEFPTTWEAWIYPTSVTSTKSMRIIMQYRTNSSSSDYIDFGITGSESGGTVQTLFFCYWNGNYACNNSNTVLSINKWYHAVVTLNSSGTYTFYLNGTSDGSGSNGSTAPYATTSGSDTLMFGREYDTGNNDPFSGTLDEMRISKTIRSADWIATEYNNQGWPDKASGSGATGLTSGFYTVGSEQTSR